VARMVWFCWACWATAVSVVRYATAQSVAERARLVGMDFIYHEVLCEDVLPDGLTASGAATSWRVYLVFVTRKGVVVPLVGEKLIALSSCACERW
jgi:hypothetical protein